MCTVKLLVVLQSCLVVLPALGATKDDVMKQADTLLVNVAAAKQTTQVAKNKLSEKSEYLEKVKKSTEPLLQQVATFYQKEEIIMKDAHDKMMAALDGVESSVNTLKNSVK